MRVAATSRRWLCSLASRSLCRTSRTSRTRVRAMWPRYPGDGRARKKRQEGKGRECQRQTAAGSVTIEIKATTRRRGRGKAGLNLLETCSHANKPSQHVEYADNQKRCAQKPSNSPARKTKVQMLTRESHTYGDRQNCLRCMPQPLHSPA